MIKAEIHPDDLRRFKVDLKGLKPEKVLPPILGPFGRAVVEKAGWYPPDFPDNTYVRTGHLGRSWYYKLIGSLEVEVGNTAVYAGWVHGPEQISIHAGHKWRRLFETGDKMINGLIEKIADRVGQLWRA